MMDSDSKSDRLVKQLSLLTNRLIQLRLEEQRIWVRLADLGCVASELTPVSQNDGARVVRLKERMVRCRRHWERIVGELAQLGAFVLDWEVLEVLLPGGPEPGSYLSWMPGEPVIARWRASKNRDSQRPLLPGLRSRDIGPKHH